MTNYNDIMTNYNDRNWHGWNGDECPVSPKSIVDVVWHDERLKSTGIYEGWAAELLEWGHVLRFRVVKENKQPRDFWLTTDGKFSKKKPWYFVEAIHVREVTE